MEEELDLKELFYIIRKRRKIIVMITIVSILLSGIYSYFIAKPVYKTSTSLIVNKMQNTSLSNMQIQVQDIQTSRMLAATYSEIIKSRRILQPVIEKLNLNITAEQLKNYVYVSAKDGTEIIEITATSDNPKKAAEIANEIADSFINNISSIMNIENVTVIDKAIPPVSKISPKPIFNMIIAAILGIVIGIFVVFLVEYMDRSIKSRDDVKKYLGLPVLGTIPETGKK